MSPILCLSTKTLKQARVDPACGLSLEFRILIYREFGKSKRIKKILSKMQVQLEFSYEAIHHRQWSWNTLLLSNSTVKIRSVIVIHLMYIIYNLRAKFLQQFCVCVCLTNVSIYEFLAKSNHLKKPCKIPQIRPQTHKYKYQT